MSRVELSKTAVKIRGQNAARQAIAPVTLLTVYGAKAKTRMSPAHLSGSGKPKPGVRLQSAIRATPLKFSIWGAEQRVEALKDYAMTEHEGSKRHRISSRSGKPLKFRWRRRVQRGQGFRRIRPSQFSYFDHVWHPGNRKPNRFLTEPLAAAAKANNFFYRSNRAA